MKKILLFLLINLYVPLSAQTLTNGQIYDYLPGDVFQSKYTDSDRALWRCIPQFTDVVYTDSIVSKSYSTANDTIFYTINRISCHIHQCDPRIPIRYDTATITMAYTDLSYTPSYDSIGTCWVANDTFYSSNEYCGRNVWESQTSGPIRDTTNGNDCFEKPFLTTKYIEGCGSYSGYINYDGRNRCELLFYKKGLTRCGNYFFVGINEKTINLNVDLFPNPAENTLQIKLSEKNSFLLQGYSIIDCIGRIVFSGRISDNSINVSMLEKGLYFILLEDKEKNVFQVKFVKQ